MRSLEDSIADRYPRWFSGRPGRLTRPLLRRWSRWSRLEETLEFLDRSAGLHGMAFLEAARSFLQLDYRVQAGTAAPLPAQGRLLVVANHPSGARDALALLHWVLQQRPDARIVANDLLGQIAPLRDMLLPVRILGGRISPGSVRAVERALAQERCVIVFPAGEVSRLRPHGIRDGRWQRGFLRFARRSGAPIVPVRIRARNSALFYGASAMFKPVGTALLPREMLPHPRQRMELCVGQPLQLRQDESDPQAARRVRRAVYTLDRRDELLTAMAVPVAAAGPVARIAEDVRRLSLLGRTSDGMEIRCGRLAATSSLMQDIGRMREITFRAVGEGSGKARDLDDFDPWYEHIVLWDGDRRQIAGAYRLARGDALPAGQGIAALYTASLFDYDAPTRERLAQGMELGRSFVSPAYWGSRSIDYLWQGIGAYLATRPQVRYLFGAVSISAALPMPAREQIVDYYRTFYGSQGATAHRPFDPSPRVGQWQTLDAGEAFAVLRDNLQALGARVPMLYRQYTDLCEPGGVRFLAFGVDPDFSDSIDGLIEVDLQRMQPRKRKRYLRPATVEEVSA
jgi:putative hemolysin